MKQILALLKYHFDLHRNEQQAEEMKKYMKGLFTFFGIKAPERKEIIRQFYMQTDILQEEFKPQFVKSLWEQPEREYQYVALDYIERSLKKLTKEDLSLFEELITTKSWWDTVDMLAQKPVAAIVKKHPEVISETIEGWANGENLWLKRSAILFQLKFKEKTDEALLYRYIEQNADSREFFIQKAIGWSLREYSKTNPQSVKTLLETHSLPALCVREARKYLA